MLPPECAAVLKVDALSKTYGPPGRGFRAIERLSFEVRERELMCIVGPSGCGKTTLLRCLSGLLRPTSGAAFLDGQAIAKPPEQLALVSQDYSRSLLPWMSVLKNVTLPLRSKGLGRAERDAKALAVLARVGLERFADRFPWQLSGGMQQRVAIARALAYEPRILLMDEPFAAVDAQARADLEDLLQDVWLDYRITVLLVTHDIDEAVYLGDRVLVLTRSPAVAKAIVDIELDRPRRQVETKEHPEFVQRRAQVFRLVREEGRAG
ncbi:MAG TPA: ABC transporter ATP-binding protein [Acidimicrobiales bacterium]|jgi:NitT/TauT family transport system ATP-binding protein|nr:ABC transporter ATP-binding protein [Acidimicrobiales bacterium]